MRIGGRDVRRVLTAPLDVGHWRALGGMMRVYPAAEIPGNLSRYLRRAGSFPRDTTVKTPMGTVSMRLDTAHDLLTLNEIFARGDYEADGHLQVAVDIGANIGIASLYFLTRNRTSRVYCVEPDPKNIARLKRTLAPYRGRYTIEEVAADLSDGNATLFTEPTGRYGGLVQGSKQGTIPVHTRAMTSLVDAVLAREDRIDVLKVDVEGLEEKLVRALRPDQLDRISVIYYETPYSAPLHTDRYNYRFGNQTNALRRKWPAHGTPASAGTFDARAPAFCTGPEDLSPRDRTKWAKARRVLEVEGAASERRVTPPRPWGKRPTRLL